MILKKYRGRNSNHETALRYDMIINDCSWVSTKWQWSIKLYKSEKETVVYKNRNNTQNNTKTQNNQNRKQHTKQESKHKKNIKILK